MRSLIVDHKFPGCVNTSVIKRNTIRKHNSWMNTGNFSRVLELSLMSGIFSGFWNKFSIIDENRIDQKSPSQDEISQAINNPNKSSPVRDELSVAINNPNKSSPGRDELSVVH